MGHEPPLLPRRPRPRAGRRASAAGTGDSLDSLAHALLEHETLDGPAAYRAAGQPPPPSPAEEAEARLVAPAPVSSAPDRGGAAGG